MAKKPGDRWLRIGRQPIKRLGARPDRLGKPKKAKPKRGALSVATAGRVARRAPEVMVRITGKTTGLKHMVAHLRYIHRHGKLEGETSDGSLVIGLDDVKGLAQEWHSRREVGPRGRQDRSKDTVNMVLSMQPGTPREAVAAATRRAAERIFGGKFDYVMVTHTDTDHPHVHVTANARGVDGQRLLPNPEDLQRWREIFAESLREQGVEAEATARDVRGVARLTTRNAIYHMERRGAQSEVRAQEVREAIAIVTGQMEKGERPWEAATKKRIERARAGWVAYAERIEALADPQLQEDAKAIRAFVAQMPEPMTRREVIERQVARRLGSAGQGRAAEQERGEGDRSR